MRVDEDIHLVVSLFVPEEYNYIRRLDHVELDGLKSFLSPPTTQHSWGEHWATSNQPTNTRANKDVYPIVSLFVYDEYKYRGSLDLVALEGLKPVLYLCTLGQMKLFTP